MSAWRVGSGMRQRGTQAGTGRGAGAGSMRWPRAGRGGRAVAGDAGEDETGGGVGVDAMADAEEEGADVVAGAEDDADLFLVIPERRAGTRGGGGFVVSSDQARLSDAQGGNVEGDAHVGGQ